jgi:hypothetical protein
MELADVLVRQVAPTTHHPSSGWAECADRPSLFRLPATVALNRRGDVGSHCELGMDARSPVVLGYRWRALVFSESMADRWRQLVPHASWISVLSDVMGAVPRPGTMCDASKECLLVHRSTAKQNRLRNTWGLRECASRRPHYSAPTYIRVRFHCDGPFLSPSMTFVRALAPIRTKVLKELFTPVYTVRCMVWHVVSQVCAVCALYDMADLLAGRESLGRLIGPHWKALCGAKAPGLLARLRPSSMRACTSARTLVRLVIEQRPCAQRPRAVLPAH